MSIITPSRADLLPLHDPLFGPLQPSAMPAPPPSASPHVATAGVGAAAASGPFPLAPILERSRLEQYINGGSEKLDVTSWRKGVDHGVANSPRVALARVNTNTAAASVHTEGEAPAKDATLALASTSTVIPKSKPAIRSTSTSIPRPAAIPDVFADDKASFVPSIGSRGLLSTTMGKRARDSTLPGAGTSTTASTSNANASSKRARVEEDAWKTKWLKSFPNLVFHFEIGTEGNGKVLENRVKAMGAFFSTRVTHLIAKPSTSPKKAMPPPRRPVVKESAKNPFSDGTGVTDLVQKAEALNIKVWTVDKLVQILTRLAPMAAPKDSLHTLLEDERIHGTRERDLNAPRPDYYYFKPGSKYLLIEDATNKHRTIMVKEYPLKDGVDWPVLYEKFLRPSAANQASSTIDPAKIRDRAWALYVDGVSFEGERPPVTELKRSTSLRALPATPKLPDAVPYQNASGNSVVLTSNIASTSTAGNSPAMFGQNAMGMFKDRALSQMNKRVQVLKGNARLAAAKRSSTTEASIAELCSRRTTSASAQNPSTTSATSNPAATNTNSTPSIPAKTFLSYNQLVGMLEQARMPVTDADITTEMRIKNREKVENGLKGREQETAAGYCENCRVRYSDLSVHIESKRHRKFAANDANFASLDKLLSMLGRPVNPKVSNPEFPPCEAEHSMDADCELCTYCPSEATHTSGDMSEFVSSQGTHEMIDEEEAEGMEEVEDEDEAESEE